MRTLIFGKLVQIGNKATKFDGLVENFMFLFEGLPHYDIIGESKSLSVTWTNKILHRQTVKFIINYNIKQTANKTVFEEQS